MKTKRYSNLIFTAILSPLFFVTGCQTMGETFPEASEINGMPAARLPVSKPGDLRYFSNGRRERVTAIEGEQVVWRRSSRTRYLTDRNFVIPESFKESTRRQLTHHIEGDAARLWPMQQGIKGWFSALRTTTDKETGNRRISRRDWSCLVDETQRITVIAGAFDVYRVNCTLSDEMGKFKKRRYWYYAPDIEQVVLQINTSPSRQPKRLELTAFQPALPSEAKEAYRDFFQEIMETQPSGQSIRWDDPDRSLHVDITPIKTLRLKGNTYCRNYRMSLQAASGTRQGAGMACRNEKGDWRVPRRVEGS